LRFGADRIRHHCAAARRSSGNRNAFTQRDHGDSCDKQFFLLDGAQTMRLEAARMLFQPQQEIDMGRERLLSICVQFKGQLKEYW